MDCAHSLPPGYVYERDWVAYIVNVFLLPIVCVFGCCAALLCVIVFTRRQMRSSLNIYLAGLSTFDFILLAMSLLIYPPMQMCLEQGRSGAVCHFFWRSALVTYPLSLMAQTGSVYTCVAVTVDRFIAVRYPLHCRIWCTTKSAMAILITITVASSIYKLPSIFELTLSECGELRPTTLRNNPLYIVIYNTYGYVTVMLLVPWGIMIGLNSYVIHAVHRAYRARRSLQQAAGNVDKEKRCTIMALVMILAFIVCNSFAAANNIIEGFNLSSTPRPARIPLGNLLICINSACNVVIYSLFGARFRQVAMKMLCGKNVKNFSFSIRDTVFDEKSVTRRTSFDPSSPLIAKKSIRSGSIATPTERILIGEKTREQFLTVQQAL